MHRALYFGNRRADGAAILLLELTQPCVVVRVIIFWDLLSLWVGPAAAAAAVPPAMAAEE